ncbi:MlaD family protein [Hydrogenimonas urashimensis]|uniref:MlaD family protein n=1 Tax=Hydrogenimonas urashimensis TaxID=2740515 RepID=UPI001915434C|nr:MlaD family protein [Hydrogenimonas urashimensis]
MADTHHHGHRAVEKGRGTLWLVWLIPIVALLMAGWLVYKHYTQKGVNIIVVFDSGKGLEVDKTPLVYQGIKIGTVTDINIDANDLYKVKATITVDPRAEKYVTRKGTKFIKVEPKISLTEVTGLDTILSGVYIDLYPAGRSKNEILAKPRQFHFNGLDRYPPKRYEKGLYLTLKAPKAAVRLNAPVLFKSFIVGKVIDKRLENDDVLYTVFIEDRYANLINSGTRFWKVSGAELQANLAGVKIKMDSLATLLAGGVAFETPEGNFSSKPKDLYTLYNSKLDTHLDENIITVVADKAYNVDPNFSSVMYKGFKVGKIISLHYDTKKSQTVFKIRLSKKFSHLANEKAWFWIVRPIVGIREVKGLNAILSGPYIAFDTLDINASPKKKFVLHDNPIPLKGKIIHLSAIHAESLKSGTAILYKDIPIGQINKVSLQPERKKLDIEAIIFEKYASFLNDSSMFYVKSGVEVEMSLTDIHIESASLETLVLGGVAMVTLDRKAPQTRDHFFIFKDYKSFHKARYLKLGGAEYHILMKELGSLSKGSPILYRKFKAGEIISYRYLPESDMIDVLIFIQKQFRTRINASTRFRNVSGIELKVDFPEIKLKTASMETVLTGGLCFETPDPKASPVKSGHRFRLFDETVLKKERYDTFELWLSDTHDIKPGTQLLYKNFPIGKVDRLTLKNNMIKAEVLIEKGYSHLLRSDSVIWLKTFQMDLNGVSNIGSAVSGPALALTPGVANDRSASFILSETAPPPTYGKTGLRIIVEGDRRSSLDVGSPLYYRQVPIGKVESWVLSDDATHVDITLFIEPRYAHLVRKNSKFYMAGAFGMDVSLLGVKIRTETLKTMISGGIGMAVPDNPGPVVEDGHIFPLFNEEKEEWKSWRPKL